MTTPPVNITEEAIGAYEAAYYGRYQGVDHVNSLPEELDAIERDAVRQGLEAVAPLIAAQVLQAEERIEWGLRWDVSDHVTHGRSGAGDELYDEQSARAAAEQYEHATAVYRRAAGPWTDAP